MKRKHSCFGIIAMGQVAAIVLSLLLPTVAQGRKKPLNPPPYFSIDIWEGIPSTKSSPTKEVTLSAYLPKSEDKTPHPAIIVCPGGSYHWLDRENEGSRVAKWLNDEGIAAFVLEYRVAGVEDFVLRDRWIKRGNIHPDMISDLQRSIQLVREMAAELNIDPEEVGAMGFSAGGHLVMSSACLFHTNFLEAYGIVSDVSLRPDFVAPIYPVVSLSDERVVHKRSRRGLLGERRQHEQIMKDSLSLEKKVKRDTPPVFLLNCRDDDVVDYRNSVLLDSALTAMGVPHRYILYECGGHGFGAAPEKLSEETSLWQKEFIGWLKDTLQQRERQKWLKEKNKAKPDFHPLPPPSE